MTMGYSQQRLVVSHIHPLSMSLLAMITNDIYNSMGGKISPSPVLSHHYDHIPYKLSLNKAEFTPRRRWVWAPRLQAEVTVELVKGLAFLDNETIVRIQWVTDYRSSQIIVRPVTNLRRGNRDDRQNTRGCQAVDRPIRPILSMLGQGSIFLFRVLRGNLKLSLCYVLQPRIFTLSNEQPERVYMER